MKESLYQKIKCLKNKFVPKSKESRSEFFNDIVSENLTRMMIISLIFLVFEIYIMLTAIDRTVFEKNLSWFLLFFHGAAIALVILYRQKRIKLSGEMSQLILSFYCFVLLYWSITVSLIKAATPGALTMYSIILSITSTMILRRVSVMLVTNISLYLYFVWQLLTGDAFNNTNLPPLVDGGMRIRAYLNHSLLIMIVSSVVGLFIIYLRLQLHREMKRLEQLGHRDSMTMLLNHVNINQSLKDEICLCKTCSQSLCAIMIDIDLFKAINDAHGHLFGDGVIKKIAAVIRENSRSTDHVGRYGGEEFLIVMPNTSLQQGYELSERLRKIIQALEFDNGVKVTVSIGLKELTADETAEDLIERVDEALYKAKNRGRNRVEIAGRAS